MATATAPFLAGALEGRVRGVALLVVVESGGGRKARERVVTKLQTSGKDARAFGGAVRRLSNHSKAMQLRVLEQLLEERNLELALPVYNSLRKRDWYRWNAAFHARLVGLLAITERSQDTDVLVLQTPELNLREEMNLQLCLIENYGKVGLLNEALAIFHGLQSHPLPSAGYLSHRALMRAYMVMNRPHEAYLLLADMRNKGLHPSLDDYKSLLHAFGRGGHLADMENLICELHDTGRELDQSGTNMTLSAYAQANRFDSVIQTLHRMHSLNIPCTINSYNAISRSCPSLISVFELLEELPQSAASFCDSLELRGTPYGELQCVRELLSLGIPGDSVKWEQNVWELDLHQMLLGTTFVALFSWLQQLKARWRSGMPFAASIRVVTGWGKHSEVEGRSAVRERIVELLARMKSPFRPDSHNRGVLMSRGFSVKDWLALADE